MPSTSRQLEGISNLAFQDDFAREQTTSTPRVRISSSTISDAMGTMNRQRSNTIVSRAGAAAQVPPLQLSPSLLVSNNPNGVVTIENDRNSQTITPPVTPSRKRPLPPWLRRSLAQSHHSPYSLWPSLTREANPLPSQHNIRLRSYNPSNPSPRLSSVSSNPWRRSTSSMPSRFM